MSLHHVVDIHPVDVVGSEDHHIVGILVVDQVHRLVDGIGTALVPLLAGALLGRYRGDVRAQQWGQPPGQRDVAVQRVGLVLGEHTNLGQIGVRQVGQHEVDQAIGATEGHCGLGTVGGKRHQPFPLATGQDNGQDIRSAAHALNLGQGGVGDKETRELLTGFSPTSMPGFHAEPETPSPAI